MKTVHINEYRNDDTSWKDEILRTLLNISNSLNIIANGKNFN